MMLMYVNIQLSLLVIFVIISRTLSQFTVEPTDTAIVVPAAVSLMCEFDNLPLTETPRWYRITGTLPVSEELWNGRENRFFIAGNRNAGQYNLFINSTVVSDSGQYSCSYESSSTRNATLTVLPTSWLPVCRKEPVNELSRAGDPIDMDCSSRGSNRTTLRWLRNNVELVASQTTRNGTTASAALFEFVPEDRSVSFTCEASIPGLEEARQCFLGPYPEDDPSGNPSIYIPFIIVGILSVVVVLLFVIVLYILFRHRQCRFCQIQRAEPQMVLDVDAIAAGQGFSTILDDDDPDVESGAGDITMTGNQPDLLTSITTRTNLAQKSPNSTIRDNLESGKRGKVPAKKHAEIEKLRPSEIKRMKRKHRSPSGSSHGHTPDAASSSGSPGNDCPRTPTPASTDQNETPRSATTSPTDSQSSQSHTGLHNPGFSDIPINDLDASIGRKNKFVKKKPSRRSTSSTPPTSPRNITEVTGSGSGASSSRQSDTVIYAELDFSKHVGMNILGDEEL